MTAIKVCNKILSFLHSTTISFRSLYTVTPGSEQIRATIERDGIVSNGLSFFLRHAVAVWFTLLIFIENLSCTVVGIKGAVSSWVDLVQINNLKIQVWWINSFPFKCRGISRTSSTYFISLIRFYGESSILLILRESQNIQLHFHYKKKIFNVNSFIISGVRKS